jgi:hypothetical protein
MHNHRNGRNHSRPTTFAVLTATTMALAATLLACDSPSAVSPGSENIADIHAAHVKGSNPAADYNKLLAQAKAATAKYHNVDAAVAAGYVPDGFGCISDPALGAMGIHYINLEIDADPAIDVEKPELLLYEPDKHGKLKLVGVEYEVFQADWHNAGNVAPPKLFGTEFEAMIFPGLDPLYGLHVWLWRHNPENMIQAFNRNVSCP